MSTRRFSYVHTTRLSFVIGILCLTCLASIHSSIAAQTSLGEKISGQLEVIIREAYNASSHVQSGIGAGVFEYSEQQVNGDLTLKEKATAECWFVPGKYHVKLTFEGLPRHLVKRTIICDGISIMYADFWRGIEHPTGAEAYLYAATGQVRKAESTSFPWDVSCLPKQVFDAETFFSKKPMPNVKWTQDGKVIRGSCPISEKSVFEFTVSGEFGFNAVRRSAGNISDKEPVQVVEASWQKHGGHWCIVKLVERMDMRKSNRSLQQWPLAYSTFTPNAEVPAGKFNLDALELPENSRILDQRPNAPQRSYHYFRADKAEKKTEDLRDQVRTMPITPKIDNDFEPTFTGRRALLFTLALFSMLCVCLGVFFWWRKRKKTRLDRG